MDANPASEHICTTFLGAAAENGAETGRKERGAIAAQACETCRSRKQKCDEVRPKCTTCQKFGFECRYRQPQPTKRDKALVEVLDQLGLIEDKIDGLKPPGAWSPDLYSMATPMYFDTASHFANEGTQSSAHAPTVPPSSPLPEHHAKGYRYDSSVFSLTEWPVVQQLLGAVGHGASTEHKSTDLRQTLHDSDGVLLKPYSQTSEPFSEASYKSLDSLDWETISRLSKGFFDSFNILYPMVERACFNPDTVQKVVDAGFPPTSPCVLFFLILALGELALAYGNGPTSVDQGEDKNGAAAQPPGVYFFNEARKRMGFAIEEVSLEAVLMFSLASVYYSACGRKTELWRMAASASMTWQALMASKPNEMNGPLADNIRRTFWHCSMVETSLHLELDLPLTGMERLRDSIGLPTFSHELMPEDQVFNDLTHFQEQFTARIVLHRLLGDFHVSLTAAFARSSPQGSAVPADLAAAISPTTDGPSTIRHLLGQLYQWRNMLPNNLQWEDDPLLRPFKKEGFEEAGQSMNSRDNLLLAQSKVEEQVHYMCDVQHSFLRTRYYYTKYLVTRPCVFKALHHPELMTREDAEHAAECLCASLRWPLARSPPRTNKQLVPLGLFWSLNFLGILILLHLSRHHPMLSQVRTSFCGQHFDDAAAETVRLYVRWLRETRGVDALTKKCWEIVRLLYGIQA